MWIVSWSSKTSRFFVRRGGYDFERCVPSFEYPPLYSRRPSSLIVRFFLKRIYTSIHVVPLSEEIDCCTHWKNASSPLRVLFRKAHNGGYVRHLKSGIPILVPAYPPNCVVIYTQLLSKLKSFFSLEECREFPPCEGDIRKAGLFHISSNEGRRALANFIWVVPFIRILRPSQGVFG